MQRLLIWAGEEEGWAGDWRAETAWVELNGDGLRATGTQLAIDPQPYRLDYRLDASDEGFVTRVSVPDLGVHVSPQCYEHLAGGDDGARVRYANVEDGEETFTAELGLDSDGLLRHYPGLVRRVAG